MADLCVECFLGDDDAGALDVVVDETGALNPRAMVNVIETVREVRRDLHAFQPV